MQALVPQIETDKLIALLKNDVSSMNLTEFENHLNKLKILLSKKSSVQEQKSQWKQLEELKKALEDRKSTPSPPAREIDAHIKKVK
jgi:hypothetical protein